MVEFEIFATPYIIGGSLVAVKNLFFHRKMSNSLNLYKITSIKKKYYFLDSWEEIITILKFLSSGYIFHYYI